MGADRDIARLEHLLGFLAGELDVLFHVTPERGADVHQLGAVLVLDALLLPVPEHIQVLLGGLPDRFVVRFSGAIGVPLKLPIVLPDVGSHPAAEVGVAGDRLLAQQVFQLQRQSIHRPVRAVQHRQLQGIVLARDVGGDKLRPHPQIPAQRSETRPARTGGVVKGLSIPEQMPQLLLKKAAHFSHPSS